MTVVEMGLIGALCTVGGGLAGAFFSKTGSVSTKVCDVRHSALVDKVEVGFTDMKASMSEVKESIRRVDAKVDTWTQLIGDPTRGRRTLDKRLNGGGHD